MTKYAEVVHAFKRDLIARTLADCAGNRSEAARRLGLERQYLCRLIKAYGVEDARRGTHGRPRKVA